jgi:predicted amidohydrolase
MREKLSRRRFVGSLTAGLASSLAWARPSRARAGDSGQGPTPAAGDETPAEYDVALGQMLVEGGAPAANLERAEALIRRAADRGCRLIVLPECMDCGWTYPDSPRLAEPIPGPRFARLEKAARAAGIFVAAGLTERDGSRVYNAAVLISPREGLLLKHRKINELAIAHDIYAIGDRLGVVRTPLGTIGLNICADNFADSLALGHSLARMGAQIILSPSAWAVDADHDNTKNPYGPFWRESYARLAKMYDLTVIGVSNVGWMNGGVWKGRKCIGCSMAVGPGGAALADGPYGESAEAMPIARVRPVPPSARGTDISKMLKKKGFDPKAL